MVQVFAFLIALASLSTFSFVASGVRGAAPERQPIARHASAKAADPQNPAGGIVDPQNPAGGH